MFTLEKLVELKREALAATRISNLWYESLCEAIQHGSIVLYTDYAGLKVVTIWEAKPVAWRPRPAYEYHFPLVDAVTVEPQPVPITGDLVRGYYDAYAKSKDLWSQFDAEYQKAVAAHLRGELDPSVEVTASSGMFYTLPVTLLHVYEVKVVK